MAKERMYRAPTRGGDTMMTRTEYVAFLRDCANRWREEARTSTNPDGSGDQATFCDQLADDIEKGKACVRWANLLNCNDHPRKVVFP